MAYITAKGVELRLSSSTQNWVASATSAGLTRSGTTKNDVFYSLNNDTLAGGSGDDIYYLWDPKSKVVESAGQGIDTVYAQYWGAATLSANVENLFLMSGGSTSGTGNALDNIIVAGNVHATLNGMAGEDVLVGGKGADVFVIAAGNGSDAIVNFQKGFDAISLTGYGITSFSQLKALGTQTGADVTFSFSNGEKLVVRGVSINDLTGYDFNLPVATTVPTGFTTQVGNGKCYTANGWYVLNNAWGSSGLDTKLYSISSSYNAKDMTAGTTFNWSYPLNTDASQTIKAYPEVIFGVSPHGDTVNKTDKAAVFPLKVADIVDLKADYDLSYTGNTGGFNVAYDIWLTSVPRGGASTITNEVMVWLHKGDFAAFGTVVGTYTNGDFTATIYHTGTYTAVVADKDWSEGTLDIADILSHLQDIGIVSSSEYVAAIELGAEVVSGSGSLTINNLDFTVASTAADGSTIVKTVTGAGTTVETVAERPSSQPSEVEVINHAPVIDSNGGLDLGAVSINEYTKAVTTVHATDQDAGTTLAYSIVGGADASLFTIDAATGLLSFKAAPSYAAPADSDRNNVYLVTVRASDGSLNDDQTLAVTVKNVNDAPVVAANKAIQIAATGVSAAIAIGATDLDGDTLTYSIKNGAAPAHGKVVFDNVTGSFVYTATDSSTSDSFTILVSDGKGGYDEQAVTVTMAPRVSNFSASNNGDQYFGNAWTDRFYGGAGNDYVRGREGNDEIYGGAGNDVLYGDEGNDLLNGGDGNDLLYGGTGNDRLYGGAGNDTLDGGAGADYMEGGKGDDIYIVDDVNDVVVEFGNEGTDTVRTYIDYTLTANVEIGAIMSTSGLTLTGNGLANNLYGNVGNDTIYGGGGDDFIRGGLGNDRLYGDDGNDTLMGEEGNDWLYGGAGNDTLWGGAGIDMLHGGAGADRFQFRSVADSKILTPDHVLDFNRAEGDRIDLSLMDANSKTAAVDAFAFIGTGAFTGAAGQVRYDVVGGNAWVYGDVNGDKIADFAIVIDNMTQLQQSDFLL